jgi:hypothetical protein
VRDAVEVEQVVDQGDLEPQVAMHDLEDVARTRRDAGIGLQRLHGEQHRRERRAQFVAQHREEAVLRGARLLGRLARTPKLQLAASERADFVEEQAHAARDVHRPRWQRPHADGPRATRGSTRAGERFVQVDVNDGGPSRNYALAGATQRGPQRAECLRRRAAEHRFDRQAGNARCRLIAMKAPQRVVEQNDPERGSVDDRAQRCRQSRGRCGARDRHIAIAVGPTLPLRTSAHVVLPAHRSAALPLPVNEIDVLRVCGLGTASGLPRTAPPRLP